MTKFSSDVLSNKTEVIRTRLMRLKKYRSITVEDYENNDDTRDIIERNLEILIQAAVDINKFLLRRFSTLSPKELKNLKNSESFLLLSQNGLLNETLANELASSGGFRNVLAHLYDEIIPEKVIEALQKALEFYPDYLYEIQLRLDAFENE